MNGAGRADHAIGAGAVSAWFETDPPRGLREIREVERFRSPDVPWGGGILPAIEREGSRRPPVCRRPEVYLGDGPRVRSRLEGVSHPAARLAEGAPGGPRDRG